MFKGLLDYIVKEHVYTCISGMGHLGEKQLLTGDNKTLGIYCQLKCIFTPEMVDKITFHSAGCTIILKH